MPRKVFNRVKTGCVNCRKHRYKRDEKRPACTRCKVRFLACGYALDPSPATKALKSILFEQPRTSISPEGLSPNGLDIDLFGMFRSGTVHTVCGMLNKNIWLRDVPRAAQTYPALWHVSIALAAIHQSEKLKLRTNTISSANTQRYYYIVALSHFTQSTTYLKDILPLISCTDTDTESYQRQELVIVANLLYVGICNMLEDSTQAIQHLKNLFSFVEYVRFGQDINARPRGILNHKDLLSTLLFLDSTTESFGEIPTREHRSYAIPLVLQTYLYEIDKEMVPVEEQAAIIVKINTSFLQRLADFERSTILSDSERQDITAMRLCMRNTEIYEKIRTSDTISEIIRHDSTREDILDDIDAIFEQQRVSTTIEVSTVSFSATLQNVTVDIASGCRVKSVRHKALNMLKKWPSKDSASNNGRDYAIYVTKAAFEEAGPARTLAKQREGYPVNLLFSEGSDIDPYEGCECVPDFFVCRDHTLGGQSILTTDNRKSTAIFRSRCERRNDFEKRSFHLSW